MLSLLPEKPITISPSLAVTVGLEEATMLSLLDDMTRYLPGRDSQGYLWYQLECATIEKYMAFWDALDIQRISQHLRDLGLILLRSAPYSQSHSLDFAFNQQATQPPNDTVQTSTLNAKERRQLSANASPIAAHWQPERETIIALGQLNIQENFARKQIPEFVHYWRESGESQRAWGSKFIQYVKRQWAFHNTRLARNQRATTLPPQWQPSSELQNQIANEGIPVTFSHKVLKKFRLYHRDSGTSHINWDMPFFSWVKEEWQKQDTPFIESTQARPMTVNWQPDQHTLDYLNTSHGIDIRFIHESVPEFIHKWIVKKAIYSEWGRIFAEHVIEQWRFVQAGVKRNPERQAISKEWRPSADCTEILQIQLGISNDFIEEQLPEFILYWMNRGEPMHSWDNIFLREIKRQWAKANKGDTHERQQTDSGTIRTKDRSIAEQLSDTSWAT